MMMKMMTMMMEKVMESAELFSFVFVVFFNLIEKLVIKNLFLITCGYFNVFLLYPFMFAYVALCLVYA